MEDKSMMLYHKVDGFSGILRCFSIYYYYGSTAICWALASFSVLIPYTQSVGLLGRGISPSQDRYIHREQHKTE
jgi:hypothetical protein